ncbi:MAG TPA: hypothetical protein VJ783_22725 [Pirellulales bacterium]|nr:hypothetical protein [Pirellulales bacterium]
MSRRNRKPRSVLPPGTYRRLAAALRPELLARTASPPPAASREALPKFGKDFQRRLF